MRDETKAKDAERRLKPLPVYKPRSVVTAEDLVSTGYSAEVDARGCLPSDRFIAAGTIETARALGEIRDLLRELLEELRKKR